MVSLEEEIIHKDFTAILLTRSTVITGTRVTTSTIARNNEKRDNIENSGKRDNSENSVNSNNRE